MSQSLYGYYLETLQRDYSTGYASFSFEIADPAPDAQTVITVYGRSPKYFRDMPLRLEGDWSGSGSEAVFQTKTIREALWNEASARRLLRSGYYQRLSYAHADRILHCLGYSLFDAVEREDVCQVLSASVPGFTEELALAFRNQTKALVSARKFYEAISPKIANALILDFAIIQHGHACYEEDASSPLRFKITPLTDGSSAYVNLYSKWETAEPKLPRTAVKTVPSESMAAYDRYLVQEFQLDRFSVFQFNGTKTSYALPAIPDAAPPDTGSEPSDPLPKPAASQTLFGYYLETLERDYSTGYATFSFEVSDPDQKTKDIIRVYGRSPKYFKDMPLKLEGVWNDDPKAPVFQAQAIQEHLWTEASVLRLLRSAYFPGMTEGLAEQLVSVAGVSLFAYSQREDAPKVLLAAVPGLSQEQAQTFCDQIRTLVSARRLYEDPDAKRFSAIALDWIVIAYTQSCYPGKLSLGHLFWSQKLMKREADEYRKDHPEAHIDGSATPMTDFDRHLVQKFGFDRDFVFGFAFPKVSYAPVLYGYYQETLERNYSTGKAVFSFLVAGPDPNRTGTIRVQGRSPEYFIDMPLQLQGSWSSDQSEVAFQADTVQESVWDDTSAKRLLCSAYFPCLSEDQADGILNALGVSLFEAVEQEDAKTLLAQSVSGWTEDLAGTFLSQIKTLVSARKLYSAFKPDVFNALLYDMLILKQKEACYTERKESDAKSKFSMASVLLSAASYKQTYVNWMPGSTPEEVSIKPSDPMTGFDRYQADALGLCKQSVFFAAFPDVFYGTDIQPEESDLPEQIRSILQLFS